MKNTATFSNCRKYRYSLWRDWSGLLPSAGYAMFIGLNPSTADENADDPTIRRCISFAKQWGYSALCMTNIFAFRATRPEDMKKVIDPVGPENDKVLIELAANARVVVAAWGAHGEYLGRNIAVQKIIPALHCLKITKDGHPGHPLYLPKTLRPVEWVR